MIITAEQSARQNSAYRRHHEGRFGNGAPFAVSIELDRISRLTGLERNTSVSLRHILLIVLILFFFPQAIVEAGEQVRDGFFGFVAHV